MFSVKNLYELHKDLLGLKIIAGKKGLNRKIKVPEAHRPGLSLSGYLKHHAEKRILIFGRVEMEYLRDLDVDMRILRLEAILTPLTPALILARSYRPSKELKQICEEKGIPLFQTDLLTMSLLGKLGLLLAEEFSPSMTCHGTLVEVFGVGVLIQGDSAVGKSEAALGLIERGHRLISDDVVQVKKREGGYLEGSGVPLTRHHMEIRGIGIINVADLYGAVCVRSQKIIETVVHLEFWRDDHFYDRTGLDEKHTTMLGIKLPYLLIPVKPGRDVVLLVETIALNHRLKEMGYHSAQEFDNNVLRHTTARKTRKLR